MKLKPLPFNLYKEERHKGSYPSLYDAVKSAERRTERDHWRGLVYIRDGSDKVVAMTRAHGPTQKLIWITL